MPVEIVDRNRRHIEQIGWTECIIALFLILIPTILCLFVKKKWILRYQRELLTCSLGTIFAIVFVDLIPELIEDASKSRHNSTFFSLSIFGGIAFAFTMNAVHDMMDRTACDDCDPQHPCDECNKQVELLSVYTDTN